MVNFYQLAWKNWFPQHLLLFRGIVNIISFDNVWSTQIWHPQSHQCSRGITQCGISNSHSIYCHIDETFFKNCSITPISMINGHTIFWPMLSGVKGKSRCCKLLQVIINYVDLHKNLLGQNKLVILAADRKCGLPLIFGYAISRTPTRFVQLYYLQLVKLFMSYQPYLWICWFFHVDYLSWRRIQDVYTQIWRSSN